MSIEKALEELRVKAAELSESQVSEETISADEFAALDEEAQALYELSKKTLGSYVAKSANDIRNKSVKAAELEKDSDNLNRMQHNAPRSVKTALRAADDASYEARRNLVHKSNKRGHGVMKALDRLTKESDESELTLEDFTAEELEAFMVSEEFEQLDELSKRTLGNYLKKSSRDVSHKSSMAAYSGDKGDKMIDDSRKRIKNMDKAVSRLAKESEELDGLLSQFSLEELTELSESPDFDQLDELSKYTLGSYISKAASDKHMLGRKAANLENKFYDDFDKKHIDDADKKSEKSLSRSRGIYKAVDRLTK